MVPAACRPIPLFHQCSMKEKTYWFNELDTHLRAYCKFLDVILEWDQHTGISRLTITANGNARHFAKADKLVAKAPALPHWEIHSLESPRPVEFLMDLFPEVDIDPHRLWFTSPDEEERAASQKDIIVYSTLYGPHTHPYFPYAVKRIIRNILGERSAALDIGEIELANLSEAPCKDDLMHLEELPAFVTNNISYVFEVSAGGEFAGTINGFTAITGIFRWWPVKPVSCPLQ